MWVCFVRWLDHRGDWCNFVDREYAAMKDYSESILEVDRLRKEIHHAALGKQWWKASALTNDLLVAVSELKVEFHERQKDQNGKL
jgi:hypothetical protein